MTYYELLHGYERLNFGRYTGPHKRKYATIYPEKNILLPRHRKYSFTRPADEVAGKSCQLIII